jgi:hypothetical protein
MPEILLPNNWRPRPYQLPLWSYLEKGGKRAVAIWHRRAGKDELCLHWTAVAANDVGHPQAIGRVGTYWHMLPQASQARKAIWDAINPHTGKRRIDEAFPLELRETTRENEMMIRFKSGSTWQVVGSDNYNSLVGSPPIGVVFSEWALADPQSWSYIRPILAENGGWAFFITTPRGRNHGSTFYEAAMKDPSWFAEKLTVHETGVLDALRIEQERREYIREFGEDDGDNRFRQEWLCDFNAAIVGAYFGREMQKAEEEKRIGRVPYDPALPVHTAWDLGLKDTLSIWFCQRSGPNWHLIDYLQNSGVGLDWYAKELDKKPYKYGECILPHDANNGDLGTGKTRVQTLEGLGVKRIRVLPNAPGAVADGISAARMILPKCWFDAEKCEKGINALRNYRREWDEKRKTFHDRPLHDWASHPADAFRYLAMGDPQNETDWRPLSFSSRGYV